MCVVKGDGGAVGCTYCLIETLIFGFKLHACVGWVAACSSAWLQPLPKLAALKQERRGHVWKKTLGSHRPLFRSLAKAAVIGFLSRAIFQAVLTATGKRAHRLLRRASSRTQARPSPAHTHLFQGSSPSCSRHVYSSANFQLPLAEPRALRWLTSLQGSGTTG